MRFGENTGNLVTKINLKSKGNKEYADNKNIGKKDIIYERKKSKLS